MKTVYEGLLGTAAFFVTFVLTILAAAGLVRLISAWLLYMFT